MKLIVLLLALTACTTPARPPTDLGQLEARLDELRRQWSLPGMSAAIVTGDGTTWTRAFGYADLADRRPATPATVYHLASLTKPFAAVVLLQAVEEGRLDLDSPASSYGISLPGSPGIRVRHLLTHTSEGGTPGERYRYSGQRFAALDKVVVAATGASFARAVADRVLDPLGLRDTAPTPFQPARCAEARRDAVDFRRRLAQGYDADGVTAVAYPDYFGVSAGLVSTVRDLARFSIALDTDRLLRAPTRRLAFTPARSTAGERLPYGLGWFVQDRGSTRILWHYGLWTGISSLIVKVPDRGLTFILLANSDGLSREFALGAGDLQRSPFAREFLDAFRI